MSDDYKRKSLSNKAPNLPERAGGLPVPANKTAPIALSEHDALAEDLARLTRAVEWSSNPWAEYNHYLVDAIEPGFPRGSGYWREQLRAMLPSIPKARALWARLDRPATSAEIPAEIYRLVVSMTAAGTIDQDVFIETLADDVSALRPTLYELKRPCHAVRTKCEYLSIKAVIDAIKREKRRSKRTREVLLQTDHKKLLGKKSEDHSDWDKFLLTVSEQTAADGGKEDDGDE